MNRKVSWKVCIKGVLAFAKPYRTKFFVAFFMVILSTAIYTMNPTVEGMVTTQLADDAAKIMEGIPGAHVDFQ